MKHTLLFCLLFLLGNPALHSQSDELVEDGIYVVLGEYDTRPSQVSKDQRVLTYNHAFLDDAVGEPSFIVVDSKDWVPFHLAERPTGVPQEDGRKRLLLTLESVAAQQLAEFTGRHVGGRIANVIDGQVVTMHKIREAITGGKLQITRCHDNACEKLEVALRDNVVEPNRK